MKILTGILALIFCFTLQYANADEPANKAEEVEKVVTEIQQKLLKQFDELLEDPKEYARRVEKECAMFPEKDLYPYTAPIWAYANLALADPKQTEHAREQIEKLMPLAIAAIVRQVRPPDGDLKNLKSYGNQATYLATLNFALGSYRLIGGEKYNDIHKSVSEALFAALEASNGKPLKSYPSYTWTNDTILVLFSLKLYDTLTKQALSEPLIQKHFAWIREHGLDKDTGLPCYRVNDKGEAFGLPRGCDLSSRLCWMADLDRKEAEAFYANYVKHHWMDRVVAAGFAEWPEGKNKGADIDSGPVVLGIGASATGMGVGAARAMNDTERLSRLCGQLAIHKTLLPLLRKMAEAEPGAEHGILKDFPLNPEYMTGFLMGDACLFYAITWQPLTKRK